MAYLAGAFERPPARVLLRRALGGLRALWPLCPLRRVISLRRGPGGTVVGTAADERQRFLLRGTPSAGCARPSVLDVKEYPRVSGLAPARPCAPRGAGTTVPRRVKGPARTSLGLQQSAETSALSAGAKREVQLGPPTRGRQRVGLDRPQAQPVQTRCNREQHSRSSDAAHCHPSGRRGGARRAGQTPARSTTLQAKNVLFGDESRAQLVAGINASPPTLVKVTRPKGRNVVLERAYGAPEIVNDGVTIARDIDLPEPAMNIGAKLNSRSGRQVRQQSRRRDHDHNLMTQELVNQGMKAVSSGSNPVALRRGISHVTNILIEKCRELSVPLKGNDDILNIATISTSGNAFMGGVIAKAYEKVGTTGSTTLEESQTLNDEVEFTEGLTIDRGYVSPYFVNDQERQLCELMDPKILVTDNKIENVNDLIPLLEVLYSVC